MGIPVVRVVKELATQIVANQPSEQVINLSLALKHRLLEKGFSPIRAYELSEQWADRLSEEISSLLVEWDAIGVPHPVTLTTVPRTLLTYRHRNYVSALSGEGLPTEFGEVVNLLASLSPRHFLLVPACLLHIIGCEPIFITDMSGDGGIDCIGQIVSGPLRSLCIFVQAKTGRNYISKGSTQLEYQKFSDLRATAQFTQYLAALGKGSSSDGVSICYAFVANTEFESPAREFSQSKEILLRSQRQLAFWLAQSFGYNNLVRLVADLGDSMTRDLSRNLTPLLTPYRT
jgi:hypothetical protein